MKRFCVTYSYTVHEDVSVEAKNSKEALKKFRDIHPDENVTAVWEVHPDSPGGDC